MVRYVASPSRPDLQEQLDGLARTSNGGLTRTGVLWFMIYVLIPAVLVVVGAGYMYLSANVVWAIAALIVTVALVGAYYKREHAAMGEVRRLYGKEVVNGEILFVHTDIWRRYERRLRHTGQPYDPQELFRWQERANLQGVEDDLKRFLRHN